MRPNKVRGNMNSKKKGEHVRPTREHMRKNDREHVRPRRECIRSTKEGMRSIP